MSADSRIILAMTPDELAVERLKTQAEIASMKPGSVIYFRDSRVTEAPNLMQQNLKSFQEQRIIVLYGPESDQEGWANLVIDERGVVIKRFPNGSGGSGAWMREDEE